MNRTTKFHLLASIFTTFLIVNPASALSSKKLKVQRIESDRAQIFLNPWTKDIKEAKPKILFNRDGTTKGLLLTKVSAKSSLDLYGLKTGDVIISLNGEKIESLPALPGQILKVISSREAVILLERANITNGDLELIQLRITSRIKPSFATVFFMADNNAPDKINELINTTTFIKDLTNKAGELGSRKAFKKLDKTKQLQILAEEVPLNLSDDQAAVDVFDAMSSVSYTPN